MPGKKASRRSLPVGINFYSHHIYKRECTPAHFCVGRDSGDTPIAKVYEDQIARFMEENPGMAHKIVLNNRDQGNLTGILDVISFDENTIVLDTDMGLLTIKGKDLHVNRLSLEKGEIDIEGRTDSLVYSAGGGTKSGGSFWAKLFK